MRSGCMQPGTPTAVPSPICSGPLVGTCSRRSRRVRRRPNVEFKQYLRPKPVLHMAGENDPLVQFEWQKRTIEELRKLNGCGEGKPWGEHCTLYPSKTGTPVVTYIHPGGHGLPEEVPPVIVKFFKEHAKW